MFGWSTLACHSLGKGKSGAAVDDDIAMVQSPLKGRVKKIIYHDFCI